MLERVRRECLHRYPPSMAFACCWCSAQDQTMSWQPCKGAMLPLPANSGKVEVQSAVFLLFPLVLSS